MFKKIHYLIMILSLTIILSRCNYFPECTKDSECISNDPFKIGKCINPDSSSAKCSYEISIDKIKNEAEEIPYDNLFRNNKKYLGKPVVYTGEIIQIMGSSGNWDMRININKEENSFYESWSDTVYVKYYGDTRFLEDDIVKFYGLVDGILSYEAIFGNIVEIPALNVYEMELITKAGDR